MREAAEINAWDCRLLVVLASRAGARRSSSGVALGKRRCCAMEADESLKAAGITVPAVLVADPWCELAAVLDAGAAHAFPAVSELVEWARYLCTKCPECEGEAL